MQQNKNTMKLIQIACNPADWDDSTITTVGRERQGRRALPESLVARDLPEPWLAVWHGLVDTLRGVAPGEWAATFIEAQLVDVSADSAPDAESQPAISLTIHRRWDDATTAEPLLMQLGSPEAVEFFEYLTQ